MSDVAECYDPAFILPLFTHLLAPGKLFFFVFNFIVSNSIIISYTFLSLSKLRPLYAVDMTCLVTTRWSLWIWHQWCIVCWKGIETWWIRQLSISGFAPLLPKISHFKHMLHLHWWNLDVVFEVPYWITFLVLKKMDSVNFGHFVWGLTLLGGRKGIRPVKNW